MTAFQAELPPSRSYFRLGLQWPYPLEQSCSYQTTTGIWVEIFKIKPTRKYKPAKALQTSTAPEVNHLMPEWTKLPRLSSS
ncbi:hypothetical protein BGAL_0079g00330 [Botrytis galanthina]|uniref:Uncharacterized protein n=1 Tax=Botrytis galanthina TaxID=278940 RepID=A0A4V4HV96_9HELO|nr:hypothetical protein BGAL_0079g00330 [Botrytis galanthina]